MLTLWLFVVIPFFVTLIYLPQPLYRFAVALLYKKGSKIT